MSYLVEVSRSEGQWVGDVVTLQGAHAQARTLAKLRTEMDDVIRLVLDLDDSEHIEIVLDFVGLGGTIQRVADLAARRRSLKQEVDVLDNLVAANVAALLTEGLTVRDVAEVVSVSPGRISQLAQSQPVAWLNRGTGGEIFVLRLVDDEESTSLPALAEGELPQEVSLGPVTYVATGGASEVNGGPLRWTYVRRERVAAS